MGLVCLGNMVLPEIWNRNDGTPKSTALVRSLGLQMEFEVNSQMTFMSGRWISHFGTKHWFLSLGKKGQNKPKTPNVQPLKHFVSKTVDDALNPPTKIVSFWHFQTTRKKFETLFIFVHLEKSTTWIKFKSSIKVTPLSITTFSLTT